MDLGVKNTLKRNLPGEAKVKSWNIIQKKDSEKKSKEDKSTWLAVEYRFNGKLFTTKFSYNGGWSR